MKPLIKCVFVAVLALAGVNSVAAETDETAKGWSVSEPRGDWQTITIDTRAVSWSDVDVSPDGRHIAFVSDRDGAENLWIMDAGV